MNLSAIYHRSALTDCYALDKDTAVVNLRTGKDITAVNLIWEDPYAYGLSGQVVNSHRAVDDVLATVEVMKAMEAEKNDLHKYINLFGYHPTYGVDGKQIGSVTYKPQSYDPAQPLSEL